MKRIPVIISAILILLTLSCSQTKRELVVYTYDSFVADYGAGPKLSELFLRQTGIAITWRSKGDGGQLLADLAVEAGKPSADLVVGLDELLAPKALALDILAPYAPRGLDLLPREFRIDPSNRLQPFDHGWFAIIYDSEKAKSLPSSLEDFAKPSYARQLILMDPRTSAPGLGFLALTKAAYGPAWQDYWKRLAPSILAMTPGWDSGYGLFLAGEAPFVLSYSTSPAYHREAEGSDRYRELPLSDGSMREIELAGILRNAPNRRNAEKFMDFLLSREAQELLPLTQWMYPVLPGIPLPPSYAAAKEPVRALAPDTKNLLSDAALAAAIVAGR